MKKLLWLILSASIFIVSCNNSSNFKIKGKISNAPSTTIYLEKLELNRTIPFDSCKIDKKGNFELKGNVSFPTFFLLKLNDQKFITLLIDSLEEVAFTADYISFSNDYSVSGSDGSNKVKELNDRLSKTNTKIDSISSLLNLCVNDADYSTQRNTWIAQINDLYRSQMDFSKQFITKNPFSLASVLAIYQKFNNDEYVVQDLQTIKIAASALHSMFPNSVHAQTLYKDTEKLVRDLKSQEMKQFIDQYGQNSPDVVLPDINGKRIALSSLKGKVVLVQFWSANDKNSRIANEVLKENYAKFKNKGFEIYQISVDENTNEWNKAVAEDGLSWITVGDNTGSNKAVQHFNITKVPTNYLLNKDGTIIAKDLKGPAIHNKLNEILN